MSNMRLIDANKLFEKVGRVKPRNKEHYKAIGEFMNMITNSETIEPNEDCISREWIRNAFGLSEKTRKYGDDHSGYDTLMLYEIQDVIEDAPSVAPIRATGEWIAKDGVFYCSCCDNDSAGLSEEDVYLYKFSLPNYCPYCGAKMKCEE